MRPPLIRKAALLLALLAVPVCARAADEAPTLAGAWALYTQNKFVESADAFEAVLKRSPPSARVYYHAAVANYSANRRGRARQLCTYIVTNFSNGPEAGLCKKLFPDLGGAASGSGGGGGGAVAGEPQDLNENNLPPNFFSSMPPDVRERLKTPEGKVALRAAIDDYNKRMAVQRQTMRGQESSRKATLVVASASGVAKRTNFFSEAKFKRGDHPFTAEQIARDGAAGIDQNINPNCWFEASMAALAELPRGQRLLASMITYGGDGVFVVRFPGDGEEYKITEKTLDAHGIHDKAMWASLIECAQVMKFPNNRGAEGATGDQSRLAVGLGCVTGCQAQVILPGSSDPQELSRFIAGAVSSKNPIVCGTWPAGYIMSLPPLVVPQHAYTILGFDPASNMITIRNPHGKGSDIFSLDDDPNHRQFEMKEDGAGVFKMHLSLFQKYFYSVCRSFI